jgi:asparagine synthase (glutamine-hydrolysing)
MSLQFGNWNFERRDNRPLPFGRLREQLAPYGPDGESHFCDEAVDILFYNLCETENARCGEQPCRIAADQVLTWDGRLDNREDLVRQLRTVRSCDSDAAMAAAAYRCWGLACFRKLLGDWALSLWDSREQQLVLAKDFLGVRPMFYSVDKTHVQWCSVIDPLVLSAGRRFQLNREYLAGWFGLFPATHLTPYVGIHSVPPASCVVLRKDSSKIETFWRFEHRGALVYRNDADYEQHFLELFRRSVRRRLRSSGPVIAELSGGMDSSSIVCTADRILAAGEAGAPRLDTLTYHSSIEPNWNELPYVEKVEAQRGRTGYRIEVRTDDAFHLEFDPSYFMATPGSLRSRNASGLQFSRVFAESGSRVLLSGIGGDEVLGGAPSPFPQLADLLRQGRLQQLSKQLIAWSLTLRRPLFSVLAGTLALFCQEDSPCRSVAPPAWLCPGFLREHSRALTGYPRRTRFFGPWPSFQENLTTIEALRRQLTSFPLSAEPPYRKVYPYLDRDLLEFLFSIPSGQLLRPNQRRSLMRRALAGIVPQEVLQRKRKAFVIRGPLAALAANHANVEAMTSGMLCASLGVIDSSPEISRGIKQNAD